MNRSHSIVLGVAKAALPADSTADLRRAGTHWRRWRRSGAAISACVHGLLAILLVAGMPQFGAEAKKEIEKPPVEVEIVARPPESPAEKPEAKPPEKAPEIPPVEKPKVETPPLEIPPPPKAAVEPEKPAPPVAKATPQPPAAPAAPPSAAAAPPAAAPPAAASAAPPPATAPEAAPRAQPEAQWAMPQLPPAADPPPALAPPPRSAPQPGGDERGADGELVSEPRVIALPDEKKEDEKKVEHWVLDPLVVDLRQKCGVAHIRGVIEITETLANGNLRGTLRNTTRWAKCPPTETLYKIELRISGIEVTMVTAGGTTDRGVMKGGLMLLEDAYGRSVWRKR